MRQLLEIVRIAGGRTVPMKDLLTVFNTYWRDDVIGTERWKLQNTLNRLRDTSPEDVVYEIREVANDLLDDS